MDLRLLMASLEESSVRSRALRRRRTLGTFVCILELGGAVKIRSFML
jgi:hypothetical protein